MYIDEGASAPFDAIGKSTENFLGAAANGQFAVNEHGGRALLEAIRKMADWVDSRYGELRHLEQQPQLGSSNTAAVMKPYVQQVAADDLGFLTQLMAFRESLGKAEEGIKKAM